MINYKMSLFIPQDKKIKIEKIILLSLYNSVYKKIIDVIV